MKKAQKAFTLVELLVVISIIAILLAILMPALAKVKEQGRAIVCASNIKNYSPALLMYAQDNRDKCPFSFSWIYDYKKTIEPDAKDGTCPEACRWHYDVDPPDGLLWPYLKNMDVHMCPTFKSYAMAGGLNGCPNKNTRGHSRLSFNPRYSYSMNRWIGFYSPEIYHYRPENAEYKVLFDQAPSLKLSNVKRTSQCFAFSEENLWTIGYNDPAHPKRVGDRDKEYSRTVLAKTDLWLYANKSDDGKKMAMANFATYHGVSAAKRDEGKANVLFVDGHVSRIKGMAGYNAYLEYGRPYYEHENMHNGEFW